MLASGGMFSFFLAVGSVGPYPSILPSEGSHSPRTLLTGLQVLRNDSAIDFPVQGRVPVHTSPAAIMRDRWEQDRRSRS